ncbi:MAG: DUF2867 domain-containing protein [Proteobacteria bacterium]|nr:DUF2867 domain-containing protein [Pseudomonadota bacterium]
MKVEKTKLSEESRLHDHVGERDFLDCYTVIFPDKEVPIEEVVQRLFLDFPAWVQTLLNIRDGVVRFFGLKTTVGLPTDMRYRSSLKVGEHVNFFKIQSIAENEIIVGEDDSHLDFRIAIRKDCLQSDSISLSTWVHPHNLLGKLYLRMILPFHILIVTSRLKGVARHFA